MVQDWMYQIGISNLTLCCPDWSRDPSSDSGFDSGLIGKVPWKKMEQVIQGYKKIKFDLNETNQTIAHRAIVVVGLLLVFAGVDYATVTTR